MLQQERLGLSPRLLSRLQERQERRALPRSTAAPGRHGSGGGGAGGGAYRALRAALLTTGIARINGRGGTPSSRLTAIQLKGLVREYQSKRYLHTLQLSLKAFVLGFIETLPGPLGALFRDNFFKIMARVGVVSFVFLDGAKPKV